MKLSIFFVTVGLMQVSAAGLSQEVTLKGKLPVPMVFSAVEKQTGYIFFYKQEILQGLPRVYVSASHMPLQTFLDQLFQELPIQYGIESNVISVSKKPTETKTLYEDILRLWAATGEVHGRVLNEKGEPVICTVTIKGTANTTATNELGDFALSGVSDGQMITVSGISIEKTERAVDLHAAMTIYVKSFVRPLDEIITKGYYKTSQRFNTGSVSTVQAAEIATQPVSNPLRALMGRVPGLDITEADGRPGSAVYVQIRGQNSIHNGVKPLYIIDGVVFDAPGDAVGYTGGLIGTRPNPFNTLNPADIESIEVLKDADATAIYGSQGANGVILITTKRGKVGKSSVELSAYTGIGQVPRKLHLMNTPTYLAMRKEAFTNDNIVPNVNSAPDLVIWDQSRFTDWQKVLLGGTAQSTDVQAAVSGGDKNTQFRLSAGFHRETGVAPSIDEDKKISTSLKVDHTSEDKKFSAGVSLNFLVDDNKGTPLDLASFMYLAPNIPALKDDQGNPIWLPGVGDNPYSEMLRTSFANANTFSANTVLTYRPLKHLEMKTSVGYTDVEHHEKALSPTKSFYGGNYSSASFMGEQGTTWIVEPQINYNQTIGRGTFDALVGGTLRETANKGTVVQTYGQLDDTQLENIAAAPQVYASNNEDNYRYAAVFARVSYNLQNKYIINATARRDGSTRFGPEHRFSTFGALGAAWIFTEEPFAKNIASVLSFGKLRGSIGTTGNDQIGDYRYMDIWSTNYYTYQNVHGILPSSLYNPVLAWERNQKFEAALELGFLQDRLVVTASYFKNRSGNQLLDYRLPDQTGFSAITINQNAVVQNSGSEFTLKTLNTHSSRWQWNSYLSLSLLRNKLLRYPDLENSSDRYYYVLGQPLNLLRNYIFDKIDPATGLTVVQDINHDNQITYPEDTRNFGTLKALFTGGLQNQVTYKNWSLDIFLRFSCQRYKALWLYQIPGLYDYNEAEYVNDHWRKAGDIAKFPKLTASYGSDAFNSWYNLGGSNAYLQKAFYLYLDNVALSYSLPTSFIQRLKIKQSKIYCQTLNLATLFGAQQQDPHYTATPPLRKISFGLQMSL